MLSTSLRSLSTNQTLKRLESLKKIAGITRVANITRLDYIGIPVFTAFRPNSKSLTVSQGKGKSINEAKCSAIMESIEVYYAEECLPDIKMKSPNYLSSHSIPHVRYNSLNPNINMDNEQFSSINWVSCSSFTERGSVLMPYAEFCMNTYLSEVVIYSPNTTGLASGNSYSEALLHSLLEVIERDESESIYNVLNISNELYSRVSNLVDIHITFHENKFQIPCFEAQVKSKNPFENQVVFIGKGCHLNTNIALNRAITEALQSRLTFISGSRDDISAADYDFQLYEFDIEESDIEFSSLEHNKLYGIDYCLNVIKEKLTAMGLDAYTYTYLKQDIVVLKSKIISGNIVSYE